MTDMFCQSLRKRGKVFHMRAELPEAGLPQVAVPGESPMLMDKGTQSQKLQVEEQKEEAEGHSGRRWET